MKMKLDNITFAVSDMDKTVDFFEHVLGLKKDKVWDLPHIKTRLVELKGDNFVIKLMFDERRLARAKEMGAPQDYPLGYAHIVFEVDDIDIAYRDLQSRNVNFKTGVIDTPDGAKRVFFYGPDSIEMEIVQHPAKV